MGSKNILEYSQTFQMEILTGPWKVFDQAEPEPQTILYDKINEAMVNFTTLHSEIAVQDFDGVKEYIGVLANILDGDFNEAMESF